MIRHKYLATNLAQSPIFSPIAQEVVDSIPAQYIVCLNMSVCSGAGRLSTLIPLSGVGITCYHVVIKIRIFYIFT
jgi:hypothetical protein